MPLVPAHLLEWSQRIPHDIESLQVLVVVVFLGLTSPSLLMELHDGSSHATGRRRVEWLVATLQRFAVLENSRIRTRPSVHGVRDIESLLRCEQRIL